MNSMEAAAFLALMASRIFLEALPSCRGHDTVRVALRNLTLAGCSLQRRAGAGLFQHNLALICVDTKSVQSRTAVKVLLLTRRGIWRVLGWSLRDRPLPVHAHLATEHVRKCAEADSFEHTLALICVDTKTHIQSVQSRGARMDMLEHCCIRSCLPRLLESPYCWERIVDTNILLVRPSQHCGHQVLVLAALCGREMHAPSLKHVPFQNG